MQISSPTARTPQLDVACSLSPWQPYCARRDSRGAPAGFRADRPAAFIAANTRGFSRFDSVTRRLDRTCACGRCGTTDS